MSEVFEALGAASREAEQMLEGMQAMIGASAHPNAELRQSTPGAAVTDGELYERLWDAAAWNEQARAAYSAGEPACRNVQRAGRPGRFLR